MAAKRDDSDKPLSERIARAQAGLEPEQGENLAERYNMLSMVWRMTIELVVGAAIGFAIGWSFDELFSTAPLFLIVFGLFGVAAGMKVVIGTAQEMSRRSAPPAQPQKPDATDKGFADSGSTDKGSTRDGEK